MWNFLILPALVWLISWNIFVLNECRYSADRVSGHEACCLRLWTLLLQPSGLLLCCGKDHKGTGKRTGTLHIKSARPCTHTHTSSQHRARTPANHFSERTRHRYNLPIKFSLLVSSLLTFLFFLTGCFMK